MGLNSSHKRTLKLQNCRNIDQAVTIIEGFKANEGSDKDIQPKKFRPNIDIRSFDQKASVCNQV
ncbi:hypothetical protein A0H76_1340 [Hepatospora eriocheir]|uniref:Uncharacterized protein n=1 Tax=Hepatospora eriocheir TaxID=1081669 RepID=A0A1X0QHI8_9MICR|nr:hypothetical protein A0H76_1340 [Hepatospora eriocheir]